MPDIRVIYSEKPKFPAGDQHPDAKRYEMTIDGKPAWCDVIGGHPSGADMHEGYEGREIVFGDEVVE